jgi:hypothetical protein
MKNCSPRVKLWLDITCQSGCYYLHILLSVNPCQSFCTDGALKTSGRRGAKDAKKIFDTDGHGLFPCPEDCRNERENAGCGFRQSVFFVFYR